MSTKEKNEKQAAKTQRKPNRDVRFRTSENGKYIMVDITETWIFPVNYIAKIAENARSGVVKDGATAEEAMH